MLKWCMQYIFWFDLMNELKSDAQMYMSNSAATVPYIKKNKNNGNKNIAKHKSSQQRMNRHTFGAVGKMGTYACCL